MVQVVRLLFLSVFLWLVSLVFTGAKQIGERMKCNKKRHDKRREQFARLYNDNEGLWFANETIESKQTNKENRVNQRKRHTDTRTQRTGENAK